MANKLYEVIRKHPNPESAHDITIAGIKYKKGDKVGFNIFLKDNNGSEFEAEKAIELAKKRNWIKDFSGKKEEKKEEVKKDEKVSKSTASK